MTLITNLLDRGEVLLWPGGVALAKDEDNQANWWEHAEWTGETDSSTR